MITLGFCTMRLRVYVMKTSVNCGKFQENTSFGLLIFFLFLYSGRWGQSLQFYRIRNFFKKIFFLTLVSPTHSSSFSPADGFPPGCNFLGSFPVCGKFADFFFKKIEEVK